LDVVVAFLDEKRDARLPHRWFFRTIGRATYSSSSRRPTGGLDCVDVLVAREAAAGLPGVAAAAAAAADPGAMLVRRTVAEPVPVAVILALRPAAPPLSAGEEGSVDAMLLVANAVAAAMVGTPLSR